jgi:peptidase E
MAYVGGGNTEAMVTLWRENGWDLVLCAAAQAGLVLAGVSAGAVCWFDRFLFNDGTGGPMRPLRGLGLIKGGACPHYSTEPERRAVLHRAVADQTMPASHAIDDGVAVLFDANGPLRICTAEPDALTYHITRSPDGETRETALSL